MVYVTYISHKNSKILWSAYCEFKISKYKWNAILYNIIISLYHCIIASYHILSYNIVQKLIPFLIIHFPSKSHIKYEVGQTFFSAWKVVITSRMLGSTEQSVPSNAQELKFFAAPNPPRRKDNKGKLVKQSEEPFILIYMSLMHRYISCIYMS